MTFSEPLAFIAICLVVLVIFLGLLVAHFAIFRSTDFFKHAFPKEKPTRSMFRSKDPAASDQLVMYYSVRMFGVCLVGLLIVLSTGCDWRLHAENVAQKRGNQALINAVLAANKDNKDLSTWTLASIPSYPSYCSLAKPVIPQEKCFFLAVVNADIPTAQGLSEQVKHTILSPETAKALTALRGSHVVIVPAVRKPDFTGDVTPYSLFQSGNFVIADPLIFQLGD